jgi:hypothetical protein
MTRWFTLFVTTLLVIAAGLYLRYLLIEAARKELDARRFFTYEILGSRVPCNDLDVGVSVIYQRIPTGTQYESARLCLGIDGGWSWLPATP